MVKVFNIDQKTTLIRHWARWYIVGRSGSKWVRVKPPIKNHVPAGNVLPADDSIERAAASLREAHPEVITKPPIDIK